MVFGYPFHSFLNHRSPKIWNCPFCMGPGKLKVLVSNLKCFIVNSNQFKDAVRDKPPWHFRFHKGNHINPHTMSFVNLYYKLAIYVKGKI